ncbi:MAG: 50S ribosomal protein L20 [Candidatus Aureabacteria bacterium]|nr:50S ribosomal protein L20 [Candidatus Auribacterota bacterium]
MVRITNVPASKARRKREQKLAKGFVGRNKHLNRITSGVVKKALAYKFKGRKIFKRNMRSLWITRIGIAVKELQMSYSGFMNGLKKAQVILNRKMLSELAVRHKEVFAHLGKISAEARK